MCIPLSVSAINHCVCVSSILIIYLRVCYLVVISFFFKDRNKKGRGARSSISEWSLAVIFTEHRER